MTNIRHTSHGLHWVVFLIAITCVGTGLLEFLHRRGRERGFRLAWMINSLIAGSILELIVAIGAYTWNPRNDNCWCARGAYTGLIFGATVMIWVFGPGLILLFLYRQRQRRAAAG